MTSRSPKNHPTTPRNTRAIFSDRRLRWTALGAGSLLSVAFVLSGETTIQAGVREVLTKPVTATKAAATATRTAKSGVARVNSAAARPNARFLAQSDDPLQRLRSRDPEQRVRAALDDAPTTSRTIPLPDVDAVPPQPADATAQPTPFEPHEVRIAAQPVPVPMNDQPLPEPATTPSQLKKIGEIQPFFDYQPSNTLKGEVCWDLCPRPDGMPCKPDPQTGFIPECPNEFRLGENPYVARAMADCLYQWRASDLYHNPLYFEDVSLERYGHVHHELVQPFVSVGKFGLQLAGLPYQMTIDPVCKKMYTLGYYRPGECTPKKYYRVPWNSHAAAVEAGTWTGLIFLFP